MEEITSWGKKQIALMIGGSAVGSPVYLAIGSGVRFFMANMTGLTYEVDRNLMSSVDLSTAQEVLYTFDFSSMEMSGIPLSEFGQFTLSSGGKCWARANFNPITFDGNQELQIQVLWRIV